MKEGKTGRDGMGRKEEQGWERAALATHLPAGARAEQRHRQSHPGSAFGEGLHPRWVRG